MPVYDVDSMNITASQVDKIVDDFLAAKEKLKGVQGDNPFGEVEDPENPDKAAATVGSFTSGMQDEFDKAAGLVAAASTALRDAVRAMGEADSVAAENLTLREA